MIRSTFTRANLDQVRVFLRVDANVPIVNGIILNDFRLKAIEPTLTLLAQKNAKIIMGTHLDRPHAKETKDSTKVLLPWFVERGYAIDFASTLTEAYEKSLTMKPQSILLLENLRFDPGERNQSESFARSLRELAGYYVNDAFALLHRNDTSITLLPALFQPNERSIGHLIEFELVELEALKKPKRPFIIFIGGGKVKDKLPFIKHLIDIADTLVILPAVAFTFLKAQGIEVGHSLVADELLDEARTILSDASQKNVRIIFPCDYLTSTGTFDGPLKTVKTLSSDSVGISVGPESLKIYQEEIQKAKTIFLNGAMGIFERPETLEPLYTLLQAIAQSSAYTVVGGGESVAAVYQQNLQDRMSFCSTGGGSTLYYLTYGMLPALDYYDPDLL